MVFIYNIFVNPEVLTWINPFPTMESLHMAQKKQSLCQAKVSKATNLVLPRPPLPKQNDQQKPLDKIVGQIC
jgi:hypothetical protein